MILNFAHRGSLTEAPENTLPAIQKSIEHGAKGIELDVQLTKDGHMIVVHDQKLTRFNPKYTKWIRDYTLKEIKEIDIGTSFSKQYAGETLATFEEILSIIPRDTILNVEIKNIPIIYDGIEEKLISILRSHNRLDNILISSFDHGALQRIQKLAPEIPLGLLLYYRILNPWEYAKNSGLSLSSVHPHYSYTDKQFIDEFHKLGLKVYPYTVSDMETYQKLLDLGVDGVFTNSPEIFGTKS